MTAVQRTPCPLHGQFGQPSKAAWHPAALVMAFTYQIHPKRALVVVTHSERVGAEAWEAFLSALVVNAAYARGLSILEDSEVRALTDYEDSGVDGRGRREPFGLTATARARRA